MWKTAAFYAVLLSCAVLAGTSGEAQALDPKQSPVLNHTNPWGHGWGISSRARTYSDPKVRKRIAALDHMAHVHAAVHGCPEIEIVQENIDRMFARDGL